MVNHARDLIASKTREDHYTDTKLMHDLMPGSITATGAKLDMYKTKLEDVLYYIHRLQNPSQEFLEAQRQEYKRTRRFKTVKYINNSHSKEENHVEYAEVTFDLLVA